MNFNRIIISIFILITGSLLMSLDFLEDWESGSFNTNAWSFENQQGNWEIFIYQGNPGNSARFAGNPPLTEYSHTLVSPLLNGAGESNIYLTFDLIAGLIEENGAEQLSVLCRIFGQEWQEVANFTTNTPGDGLVWENVMFNLSQYVAGNMFQVGFKAHGNNSFNLMRWNIDNVYITSEMNSDPATISGYIYDQENGNALENAVVSIDTISDTTAADGYYELTVDPGSVEIEVTAAEYNSISIEYLLESGENYTEDFTLIALSSILPPAGFTAEVDSNNVLLSWQTPGAITALDEGFETWPPENWQIRQSTQADGSDLSDPLGDSWFQVNPASFMGNGSNYIHSGQYSAGIEYFAEDYNWLISPEILIQPDTQLNFWLWYLSDEWYCSNFHVCLKINDQWQTLQSWTTENDSNEMQSIISIDLGLFQGNQAQIAFVSQYNDGYEIAIDDISIGSNNRLVPDGYNLYRDGICLNQQLLTTNSFLDENLENGNYIYEVTAVYGDIESEPAPSQEVTLICQQAPDFFYLEMAFQYLDEPVNHAWLGWSAVTFSTGYNIYRNGELINPEPVTTTNYRDFSCLNPTSYEYYIVAVYENGESNPSNTQQLEYFLPAQNLFAIPFASYNYLHWEAPPLDNDEIDIIGYNIYYYGCDLVNEEPVTETEFYDYDVIPGEYYDYIVSVIYSCGESIIHGSVSVIAGTDVILPPTDLNAQLAGNDVTIDWNRPDGQGCWLKHSLETTGGSFELEPDDEYSAFVHFDQTDLNSEINKNLEQIAFWPVNPAAEYTVNFYKPDFFNPENFMLMQSIVVSDIIADSWNILNISGGTVAPNETEFKIEISCDDYSQPFLAYDTGSNSNPRSDLILRDGNWENLSDHGIDANWKIKLLFIPTQGGGGENTRTSQINLQSYKIFRDDEVLTEINHAYENWTDCDLLYGDYTYYMTSLYNVMNVTEIESNPSELLDITVAETFYPPQELQYEILDSTVVLSWEAPENDPGMELTGYSVYLNGTEIAQIDTTSFELTDLINQETYLAGIKADYSTGSSDLIEIEFIYTGTFSPADIPLFTRLEQNYPNPFNPVTNISFSLAEASEVELVIFNIKGQKIAALVNEDLQAGNYNYLWNGRNDKGQQVSSGMYFYRLSTGSYNSTQKMILMK